MRLGLTIVAVLACGCAALDGAGQDVETDDFIDMDTPPGNCSAGTTGMPCPDPGTTGSPLGGPCLDSTDCAEGWCVAPFAEGEVGNFTCVSECIPLMDESAWCLDASACCQPGAVCSARGLCVEGGLDDSGTASSGDGTASDGTASDGTASDGTASDGSGTSSGSDTGSSTGTTGTMGGR